MTSVREAISRIQLVDKKDAFPPEAAALLCQAAADADQWEAAMRDPLGWLGEHGVYLPAGHQIELYEAVGEARVEDGEGALRMLNGVRPPAYYCPDGGFPVTYRKAVTTCTKTGYLVGPPEWVSDREGTSYGHWERSITEICLEFSTVYVLVTECRQILQASIVE